MAETIDEKLASLRARGGHPNLQYPQLWNPALTLRPYQEVGALHLLVKTHFVLGDPTGTGKTPQALFGWAAINESRKVPLVLIVTKTAVRQWAKEIEQFVPGAKIFYSKQANPTKVNRAKTFAAWLGCCQEGNAPILILAWGSLLKDWDGMSAQASAIWRNCQVIFDECHRLKNPKSSISIKAKDMVSKISRVHGLTATLLKNSAHDSFGILSVLVPGFISKSHFETKYCKWKMEYRPIKGVGWKKVRVLDKYVNLDQFSDLIRPLYLGRTDEELDKARPEVQHIECTLTMTTKHRDLYLDTEAGLFAKVDDEGNLNYASVVSHAQIIATAPEASLFYENLPDVYADPRFAKLAESNTKLQRLQELLEDQLADRPVVLYSPSERVVSCFTHHLKAFNPVKITGKSSSAEREEARLAFTQGDTNIILLTDAGGESINLQRSRDLIFLSRPWDVGRYIQVVGRIRRYGSAYAAINIWHLTCEESIDELVDSVIVEKFGPYDQIVGGRGNLIPDTNIIPVEIARRAFRRRRGSRQINPTSNGFPN